MEVLEEDDLIDRRCRRHRLVIRFAGFALYGLGNDIVRRVGDTCPIRGFRIQIGERETRAEFEYGILCTRAIGKVCRGIPCDDKIRTLVIREKFQTIGQAFVQIVCSPCVTCRPCNADGRFGATDESRFDIGTFSCLGAYEAFTDLDAGRSGILFAAGCQDPRRVDRTGVVGAHANIVDAAFGKVFELGLVGRLVVLIDACQRLGDRVVVYVACTVFRFDKLDCKGGCAGGDGLHGIPIYGDRLARGVCCIVENARCRHAGIDTDRRIIVFTATQNNR